MNIYNEDCIEGSKKIPDGSVPLIICDPPFGINEVSFSKHYHRKTDTVIDGYQEAPKDYLQFSRRWITEATRILSPNGTMYIISGWSNLSDIFIAVKENGLTILNEIVWKFNFGVNTSKKFVTSHYHILRVAKTTKVLFNTYCRFGQQEKDERGGSLLYKDLEDVWVINKEFQQGKVKNANKLPNELVIKMIQYSSNEGDTVCDFFMGNFTTAYCAHGLNRKVIGFESNKNSYDHHMKQLGYLTAGYMLPTLRKPDTTKPKNQGKPLTPEDVASIKEYYNERIEATTQRALIKEMQDVFGRGYFSILNIIKG